MDCVRDAALKMKETECGFLPVVDGEARRLVGTLTDRDIAIRVVAEDKALETRVGEVMSAAPVFCRVDDDVRRVRELMGEYQISRMVVVHDDGVQVAGVISLAQVVDSLTQKRFLEELRTRLPGLNRTQALSWASAAVKHLVQSLDNSERRELEKHLPPALASAAQEATKVAELFGKERPDDFFVVTTRDAESPPSEKGNHQTLANVLAAIKSCIPEQPAERIEKGLPKHIAELWRAAAIA